MRSMAARWRVPWLCACPVRTARGGAEGGAGPGWPLLAFVLVGRRTRGAPGARRLGAGQEARPPQGAVGRACGRRGGRGWRFERRSPLPAARGTWASWSLESDAAQLGGGGPSRADVSPAGVDQTRGRGEKPAPPPRPPERSVGGRAKGHPVGGGGKSVDTSGGLWVEGEKALERGQGERSLNLPLREELPLLFGAATLPPPVPLPAVEGPSFLGCGPPKTRFKCSHCLPRSSVVSDSL